MSLVTVIVPVFNEERHISRALESILVNSFEDFELYVVDDCSTDNTAKIIEAFGSPKIKLIKNRHRVGPAESRNIGVANSTSKYVFFTDADCRVDYNWIKSGVEFLEATGADGVEGPILYEITNPSFKTELPINPFYPKKIQGWMNCPNTDYSTGNIAYQRRSVLRVAGFNSCRYGHGREDTDLAWRIKKNGVILFCHDMVISHFDDTWSLKRLITNASRYSYDVRFLKDHGTFLYYRKGFMHPYLYACLVFPPLIFFGFPVWRPRDLLFLPQVFIYLVNVRWVLWRAALREGVCLV